MKPIYALISIVLLSLACGQSTLPTATPTTQPAPTAAQVAEVKAQIVSQVTAEVGQVVTLDRLNVRLCPSTDDTICPPVTSYETGAIVEVGEIIRNTDTNCPRWYPVMWQGKGAFICAEWTTK